MGVGYISDKLRFLLFLRVFYVNELFALDK